VWWSGKPCQPFDRSPRPGIKPVSTSPKVSRDSLPGDMKLQTATLRYKREPRQECICHDDVHAVGSLENDPMKLLGRVEAGQPGTVERGAR
jgi:hypothetical protein